MEIDRLLEMLASKDSPQAYLASDEPPRIWSDDGWQSANAALAAGRLNRMLVLAAPPGVRAVVHDLNARYEFDVPGTGGIYRVNVEATAGRRSVFVTLLDGRGVPVRPINDGTSDFDLLQTAPQPISTQPDATSAPLQPPSAEEWFYMHAGQSMGPYSLEQMASLVKSGGLLRETMVLNPRLGDWQQMKLSELARFAPADKAQEWAPPTLDWQPPSEAHIRSEKALVRLVIGGVIGAVVLFIAWIGISQVRSTNRGLDYSSQAAVAAQELSPQTTSGPLHNIRVQKSDAEPDVYSGKAQYANNYLADVTIEAEKRDFWSRPQEWQLTVQAHDFSTELASLVRGRMNSKYAGEQDDFRMDSISLSNSGNNVYSGTCHWDDNTRGGVSVQITSFDSDGEVLTWSTKVNPD